MRKSAVYSSLKENGYRSTRTRDAVIDFLATQDYLVSVEVIRESARVDSVTAYRVLDVLEKLGIVYKMQSIAAYVVVPQYFRKERHLMVMIDDQNKKICTSASPNYREGIIPEKIVLELRGTITEAAETITEEAETITEEAETITEEAETITEEAISLSINDSDRLQRF